MRVEDNTIYLAADEILNSPNEESEERNMSSKFSLIYLEIDGNVKMSNDFPVWIPEDICLSLWRWIMTEIYDMEIE